MSKKSNIDKAQIKAIRKILGFNIETKRRNANLSQFELGEAIGVTASTINKIESGDFPTEIDDYIAMGIVLYFRVKFI